MIQVNISEFRANLLQYLKNVRHGEHINVFSKGTLLATVIPPANPRDAAKAELLKLEKTAVMHDVVSPIGADWDIMDPLEPYKLTSEAG